MGGARRRKGQEETKECQCGMKKGIDSMSENQIITVPEERTLKTVAFEIRTLHAQAQQVVLGYAIEIGRRLTEAKGMVSHGEWGKWLEEEVSYSKSTANNFMRIFDAYGADQQSLFGPEAKSQTLGNLPYTKALRLLAIPEEEREEFVEANNVEDLSTRELDKLIKERDEAKQAREDAERREKETADLLEAAKAGQETLQADFAEERARLQKQEADARAAADHAQSELEAAREQLKQVQDAPKISEEELKVIREKAMTEASEKAKEQIAAEKAAAEEKLAAEKQKLETAAEEARKKLEAAEKAAADAKAQAEKASEEREKLEKKLALADADTVLFKASFEQMQETFNKCLGCLMKVETNSPETAEKLKKAVTAALDSMKERV